MNKADSFVGVARNMDTLVARQSLDGKKIIIFYKDGSLVVRTKINNDPKFDRYSPKDWYRELRTILLDSFTKPQTLLQNGISS